MPKPYDTQEPFEPSPLPPATLTSKSSSGSGLPHNVRTGRRYRGVNTLLLCDTYETKGYRSKWWGTAEDWEAADCSIQQGEEPTVIARYRHDWSNQIDHSLVYNAAQVHGAEEYQALLLDALVAYDEADFGLMGMLLEHHAPDIRYDVGDHNNPPDWNGYLSPEPWHDHPNHKYGDYILMQSEKHFPSKADHYSVLLHDALGRSANRLDALPSCAGVCGRGGDAHSRLRTRCPAFFRQSQSLLVAPVLECHFSQE